MVLKVPLLGLICLHTSDEALSQQNCTIIISHVISYLFPQMNNQELLLQDEPMLSMEADSYIHVLRNHLLLTITRALKEYISPWRNMPQPARKNTVNCLLLLFLL